MIQAVFFDKTYTLIQQNPDKMKEIDKKVQQFLKTKRIYVNLDQITSLREKNQYFYRMGKIKGWKEITKKIFEKFGISSPPHIEKEYRKTHLTMGKLYPNVKRVLEELKNLQLKIGLITESDTRKVESELNREKIKDLFDVIIISSEVRANKPSVSLFQAALKKLEVEAENSIYVGDRLLHDILPAKKMDFKATIWIRQGIHSEEGMNQLDTIRPDFIIEDIYEALRIIKELIKSDKNMKLNT